MKLYHLILTIILSIFSVFSYADKPLVTFVCTGNTGRSPMAEALSKMICPRFSGQLFLNY